VPNRVLRFFWVCLFSQVSPSDVCSYPGPRTGVRGGVRKSQRRSGSEILTSSPFKTFIMEKERRKSEKLEKKRKIKAKSLFNVDVTVSQELNVLSNSNNNKGKRLDGKNKNKKQTFSNVKRKQNIEVAEKENLSGVKTRSASKNNLIRA
jgi:hypothetical protein